MIYYTYVLYDKTQNKFYIGYTVDLKRRIEEHKKGNTYTTRRIKGVLVYYEVCLSKKDALIREKQLKTGFGRSYLKRRLSNFLGA